jgi:hypothetical protein
MLKSDPVLGPALSHIDILHMNEDEIANLTGVKFEGDSHLDTHALSGAASLFLKCGVAVVAVTRGKQGCFIKCNGEDRFASTKMLPSTWINQEISVDAAWLPPDTVINSNGAGDSFTSGLLVAALLRHTGLDVMVETSSPPPSPLVAKEHVTAMDLDVSMESFDSLSIGSGPSTSKKLTPYSLYMREKYITLKSQSTLEDKKKLFLKCHDMWEHETEEVKQMYDRKCREQLERHKPTPDTPTAKDIPISFFSDDLTKDLPSSSRNLHLANQPMNLETAAQFASLVAARHIDMSTRNLTYLNINSIREQSTASPHGLEEI